MKILNTGRHTDGREGIIKKQQAQMPSKDALVSIVVLSWDKLEETKNCLKSLRALIYKNKEIIVVDNGSKDGSKAWLKQQLDIAYVDLPINIGFTGGQIAGYKVAKGKYIALINNDAVVASDWIEQALKSFAKDKKVAAVGGRAYIWDEKHKAYNQNSPFYSYQVIDPSFGYAQTLQCGDHEVSVNSISGAGVMISRSAIEKVGYFDDRFFAYYEETDLFARMKRAGYKIMYNPAVKTWHKIGVSTKGKPFFYLYHMHRNRFMYAYKNFDNEYKKIFVKQYRHEAQSAILRITKGSKETDDKARAKAYLWNQSHIATTRRKRRSSLKLGKTYSKLLLGDASMNVSIVISCYNYGQYVGKAINSALNQTQKPLEVIVINDGSTDDSLEQIKKYTSRIQIIDKKNEGVIVTKNIGLNLVKGEWIIFLDADDYLDKTYIEKCLKLARMDNLDMVYTDMQLFGAKKEVFRAWVYSAKRLKKGNYIHNSALMKTQKVKQIGGYKIEMSGGYEDWELYLSLLDIGVTAAVVSEPLLFYRQHEVNSRNMLAQEKGEAFMRKAQSLHPSLYNMRYKIGARSAELYNQHRSKVKYIKIFWPPTWVRQTKLHKIRNKALKKVENKQELNKKISVARRHARKMRVRSTIKTLKEANKFYTSLSDKKPKKKGER